MFLRFRTQGKKKGERRGGNWNEYYESWYKGNQKRGLETKEKREIDCRECLYTNLVKKEKKKKKVAETSF